MRVEEARTLVREKLEDLGRALERGQSETLKAYLAAMAKFPRYSAHNVWLILSQRPGATRVAGFTTWRRLGRQVKRGARGIAIIAPMFRRHAEDTDQLGGRDDRLETLAFRCAYVFDVSDTDGAPLPALTDARGNPGPYTDRLKAFIAGNGITLEYSRRIAPALGACVGDTILLLPDLAPAVELSTLAHELGHALLHGRDAREVVSRTVRETEAEAEAIAFLVSEAVGIESRHSSADYIQLWNGDAKTLAASLDRIQRTAAEIITAIGPDV